MKKAAIYLMAIVCIGCGVRFKNASFNLTLPDYFKARNLYDKTDIWRFKMPELVGSVLYLEPKSESYERGRRIAREGYVAKLEVIEDSERKVYYSRVDRSIAAEGSYLLFAANLDASQMADVNIEDVSLVFINDADIPWEELIAEAKRPKSNPETSRYWVQGALLSTLTINYYTEISSSASGVVGETFGAKGKVYNKQSAASRDFRISLELIDLDKLASATQAPEPEKRLHLDLAQRNVIIRQSLARGLVLRNIKK
jgi:hypothetical protein